MKHLVVPGVQHRSGRSPASRARAAAATALVTVTLALWPGISWAADAPEPSIEGWSAVPDSWTDGRLVLETNLADTNWALTPGSTVEWEVRAWLAPDVAAEQTATVDLALQRTGPQAEYPRSVLATIEQCSEPWGATGCPGTVRELIAATPLTDEAVRASVPGTTISRTQSAWIRVTLHMPDAVPPSVAALDGRFVLAVTATGASLAGPPAPPAAPPGTPSVPGEPPSLPSTGAQLTGSAVASLLSIAIGIALAMIARAARRPRTASGRVPEVP